MKAESVLVIGAGIGGITAATHLAQRGLHVTVVEKNAHPGGRCDRLEVDPRCRKSKSVAALAGLPSAGVALRPRPKSPLGLE